MAFSYIEEDGLLDAWDASKRFMKPIFEPFPEYERISRNQPHPDIPKEYPKVTDGTLASIIQEQPKRVVQQAPTGKVKSDDPWLNIVGGHLLEHEILPNSFQQTSPIQKSWALISKAKTYGAQPVFVQFINRGEYFGTDWTLPYVQDVFLEPGKVSAHDSNVIFLRSWYQPNQIDAILKKEQFLTRNAEERGDNYETGWNLQLLESLKDKVKQKSNDAMSPQERKRADQKGAIEIVHCFQRGIGGKFYSFAPDADTDGKVVRTRTNKDPRGAIPIHYMYTNVDLSNPLGRGSVEIAGGMQNLLDSEVQAYQYSRALGIDPPVAVYGDPIMSTIKYRPKALWQMGSNPNSKVEPVDLSNRSIEQFVQNAQFMRAQIFALESGGGDTSTGADVVGLSQSSKTPAGVAATEAKLNAGDNYIRKQFEECWGEVCETMLNLYFAERSGTQELKLDDDTAAKLRKLDPQAVREDNMIMIDYDSETPKLKFEVDPGTSSAKDDVAERDRLVELLDLSQKYPTLGNIIGEKGVKELTNRIIVKTGVEDPEKIMPSEEEIDPETGQPKQVSQQMTPEMVQQMIQEAMQQAQDKPKSLSETLSIKLADMPEDARQQALIAILGEMGIEYVPQQQTPIQDESDRKDEEAHLKAIDMAHRHADTLHKQDLSTEQAQNSHMISASDAALRVAQAEQPQEEVMSGR